MFLKMEVDVKFLLVFWGSKKQRAKDKNQINYKSQESKFKLTFWEV